jgi:hypothetical protein
MGLYRPGTVVANIAVDKNGTLVGTEPDLNFSEGANTSVTITDNAASNRVDVTISSVSTNYSAAVLATNPASYWHLDETTGTLASDVNSLVNGTYSAGVTLAQAALIASGGTSVSIATTNSVNLGAASYHFSGISAFSWAALVNVADDAALDHIILDATFSDGSGLQGYNFQLKDYGGSGGSPVLTRYRNNVGVTAYSASAVPLGSTAHLVSTYDGLNSKVYLNGTLTATGATDTASLVAGSSSLYLGNNAAGTRPLRGLLDEPAVWARALSASEIATLYSAV